MNKSAKPKIEKPVKITKALIDSVLRSKQWILRRSDNGVSHHGFKWASIGCWTVAPDWNKKNECGGGLHGNGPSTAPDECNWSSGTLLEFCEIGAEHVSIGGPHGKIKTKRARILLINELPEGLKKFVGSLDLQGCTGITSLPAGLKEVNGSLDLQGTGITQLPEGLHVGGYLDLHGTKIKEIPKDLKVDGEVLR